MVLWAEVSYESVQAARMCSALLGLGAHRGSPAGSSARGAAVLIWAPAALNRRNQPCENEFFPVKERRPEQQQSVRLGGDTEVV